MSDKKIAIGFLGPDWTFSYEALLTFKSRTTRTDIKEAQAKAYLSFAFLYAYLHSTLTEIDKVFIPIENSSAGGVAGNLDLIAAINTEDIFIEAEHIEPIKHCLGVKAPYKSLSDIPNFDKIVIASHPQPIEQSSKFISDNFAHYKITIYNTNSTVGAIQLAAGTHEQNKQFPTDAVILAIASEKALKAAGLNIIAYNIEDNSNNATRFVLLGSDKTKPTGYDKTSIVITLPADKAGALYEVLGVLAKSEPPINMTKIESRPTKDEMGEYWFFIDIEGHQDEEHIGKALEQIKAKSKEYKFLGSYPRFRR